MQLAVITNAEYNSDFNFLLRSSELTVRDNGTYGSTPYF